MKKIIGILTGTALAAGLFAVDFSATIKAKGSVSGGTLSYEKDEYKDSALDLSASINNTTSPTFYAPFFANNDLKDADMLEVHFSGDKAGADFKFYVGAIADNTEITTRGMDIWFKPIDQLKVTLGNVGLYLYTERLNWWKVPCGSSAQQFKDWNFRWSSTILEEQIGAAAELTLGALYLGAGVAPGGGNNWWEASPGKKTETSATADGTTNSTTTEGTVSASYLHWGAVAKYDLTGLVGLPVSVGAGFRDSGKMATKIGTFGADFGNWSSPYYGFVQGKFRIDPGKYEGGNIVNNAANTWNGELYLSGVTIDNYFSYNFGFMKAELTAPVTIRFYDPSYWTLRAKVSVPMGSFTLYGVAGSPQGFDITGGSLMVWYLEKQHTKDYTITTEDATAKVSGAAFYDWGAYLKVGVSFNVGAMSLDMGIEAQVSGDVYRYSYEDVTATITKTNVEWAIPFVATISF